ncbi:B cell linker [Cricetulus griseus]
MPAEETGDDSYEPPPAEQQTRVVHPALPFTRGEYVDNRSSQRHSPPFSKTLPSKPCWPSAKTRMTSTLPAPTCLQKPQIPPKPKDLLEDEADYVVPVEDHDENYIHPRESIPLPAEKVVSSKASSEQAGAVEKAVACLPLAYCREPQPARKQYGGTNLRATCMSQNSLDKEAELHGKPWYAGACDRKSAEEALHRSNKYFGSVVDIIQNHQHNPLVLIDSQNNTKDSTRLKYAVKVS